MAQPCFALVALWVPGGDNLPLHPRGRCPPKDGVFLRKKMRAGTQIFSGSSQHPHLTARRGILALGQDAQPTRHLVSKGPALLQGNSVSYSPAPFTNLVPLEKFSSEPWPYLPCWEGSGEGPLLSVKVWGVQQQAVSQHFLSCRRQLVDS